uniref:Microcin C transport system substrate-binding protein n=1 Tax=Candidatus Kentrum sp. MB TaxID=2138164 RepID=A0A451BCF3_9GAMM|nr:MAG: microcin C transport system substrate-binding protein [Candidatus Kentron sp. MB]VFK32525.1 MAG: microcin C transport system substrate-binding protein [Candidatus Kentron sp. MB]VFK75961.1 MAG: microcin C transport system substrate-binding protein [Candidatus Kentron sp. MB]
MSIRRIFLTRLAETKRILAPDLYTERLLPALVFMLLAAFCHASADEDAPSLSPSMASSMGPITTAHCREGSAHAMALHGEPKYRADFTHFDYVNPAAPKGGDIHLAVQGVFDSFHAFIPKGNAADDLGLLYDPLLVNSSDEPFTEYGLIAECMEIPEDRSQVTFTLRKEARWHDGRPITVEDVIWTFETLITQGHPSFRFYYANVAGVEKSGERRVTFTFKESGNRELPLIVGQMSILPRHYWENRDFSRTTLEPPLGSGPYRIASFDPGRRVVLERVPDYWAADLPVRRGQYNFDRMHYDYYRDATVIREALKAGEIDFRLENQAKAWATDYRVPAVRKGWLIKESAPHRRPAGMQAFVMNTRRPVFADRRARLAFSLAMDFEWTNKNLFFSQYTRTESYFANSELAAIGLPSDEELAILEPHRDQLPPEVFTTPYRAPTTDGSGWPRKNLLRAARLLDEAGWVIRDMERVRAVTGELMAFEILLVSKQFERIALPFVRNLKRLGVQVRVRLVDSSQYINRLRAFDFDMFVGVWGQSDSPGNEQRNYWSSASAHSPAARNFAGIRDPVVDRLIERLIEAPDRAALVTRARALDRVLLHGHYVIPNWHHTADRLLYWDKFSRPEHTAPSGVSLHRWWYDEEKATRLAKRRGD